jgi:hypothetical protein
VTVPGLDVRTLTVLGEGRGVSVEANVLVDRIEPMSANVYVAASG